MTPDPYRLPEPSANALAHSAALAELIREEIERDGPVSFARFMERALYEPGYGYYMNALRKFGEDGDFITAPEIAPLFSHCLARQCAEVIGELGRADVLEFGAGSGAMAVEVLQALAEHDALPGHYCIVELSGPLCERQREAAERLPAELRGRLRWLDSLEGVEIGGVVLANEVLDAMPVERFVVRGGRVMALAVGWDAGAGGFTEIERPASAPLAGAVAGIQHALGRSLPEGYCSEANLRLPAWWNTVSGCLREGVAIAVDYGYPRHEYYLPEREMGTLMCHYRQRAHDDPYRWAGLQDITAHVDFSAVAEAAAAAGFDVAGYTGQAEFLIDCGLESWLGDPAVDTVEQLRRARQAKTLLLPGEMGERFKAIALAKRYNRPLLGFSGAHDRRHRL